MMQSLRLPKQIVGPSAVYTPSVLQMMNASYVNNNPKYEGITFHILIFLRPRHSHLDLA